MTGTPQAIGAGVDSGRLDAGSIDHSTPVLVLTASPRARRSPHGAIGILRSLGRLGVPVFTVDSDPRGPASYSRYIRERFVFDLATASPEASVEYLLQLGRRWASRPILIPTWDEASVMVSDHADELRERYQFPAQPDGLPGSLADKKSMYHLARRHQVPTPRAIFPSSIEDVRDYAAMATFPVMLKGILGNALARRTGRTMVIVDDPDELVRLYQQMEDPDTPNLMLQEYIPGGDDVVWMFNGYFDAASDCLFGITGRKLRQTPIHTGATSLGVCERNEIVAETTRRWMKELGYSGILDIGYRYDARDGKYKVLDVNPRIGGTFRLFVASNGLDVARAMYLDLTGQPVPMSRPVEGRKWLDEVDVRSCLHYRRAGELTMRQWATSLVGLQETVYVARDDPAPFVRVGARELRSAAERVSDAIRSRLGSAGVQPQPGRPGASAQDPVDRHFDANSDEWRTLYEERSTRGRVFRERQSTALAWIDSLHLLPGSRVLEIGCGAGLTTVALAERGFEVTAVDSAAAMLELTGRLAQERGVADRIEVMQADVHDLPFPDDAFGLVLALGVVPWLHSPHLGLKQLARVTQPGGYVLASSDNALRMNLLLDPRLNPLLSRPRRAVGRSLRRAGVMRGSGLRIEHIYTPGRFRALMGRAGLRPQRETTVGFGPFSLWQRPVLSERDGIRLHRRLQALADGGMPGLRAMGAHQLILARRPLDTKQEAPHR